MKLQLYRRCLIFCLIPLVQAYHVFETNCSAPSTLSNYVSPPNTRGTLDILWSSLFTILACTWILQHPNISKQRDGRDPGLLGNISWGLKGFYRSTMRMLWTIIAPELIMAAACEDLLDAREDNEEMQKWVEDSKGSWSLTHSYYANMGGFVLRGRAESGGEIKYHDPYHLNSKGIYALIAGEHINKLPDITEGEIKDKSKGDLFVKAIAVGQILWSVIQIIGRAARRLPVSPLEVAVVAFAVCAIFIYGLYWHKPQRVGIATTIQLKETSLTEAGAISDAVLDALKDAPKGKRAFGNIFSDDPLPGAPISLDTSKDEAGWEVMAGAAGATVFGAIHVVAWNFAFPSRIDLIFWRCASVYTTAAPIGFVLFMQLWLMIPTKGYGGLSSQLWRLEEIVVACIQPLLMFLYIVARLVIIVEMFRTLCFLPPRSYISTWTSNIPHVG
ncbi:hypothetical protein V8C34DRAFT_324935 [Trichoderma compactum]